MSEDVKVLSVRLPRAEHERIVGLALEAGVPVSEFVRAVLAGSPGEPSRKPVEVLREKVAEVVVPAKAPERPVGPKACEHRWQRGGSGPVLVCPRCGERKFG